MRFLVDANLSPRVASQPDGNSVFPGLPVPCRCPPPQRSPSRMCRARSGATCSESGDGRSGVAADHFNVPCRSRPCGAGGKFSPARRCHPLIRGARFLVVFRAAAYFRELSTGRAVGVVSTVLAPFRRLGISALFGIVVMDAGGPSIATRISFCRRPYSTSRPLLCAHVF